MAEFKRAVKAALLKNGGLAPRVEKDLALVYRMEVANGIESYSKKQDCARVGAGIVIIYMSAD